MVFAHLVCFLAPETKILSSLSDLSEKFGQVVRLSSSGFCGLSSKHVHAESKENRMYTATLNIHT